ncbi:MAG: 3-hydroxybutyryl-CoA dehydrogenase [Burkholderiaceae bacterium]|jgi:3-hydroxybutyryl-CoA dehydrogenase
MPALIGLIGAGRMGRGIAQAFAFAGHEAILIDIKRRSAEQVEALRRECLAEIDAGVSMMARLGAIADSGTKQVVERARFAGWADAPEALGRCDVLFECVPETVEAKRSAFAAACPDIRDDAVIASTTSTILSSELAALVSRPERFLNAHWLNPAFLVPVVELSPHATTSPQALQALESILRGIGKRPVRCAASPGYIVPRLQSLILNEAARMVEEGVASPAQIDEAIRFGFGFRYATMGALEFIDFGGLDILYHANRYLEGALGERYRLAPVVERYMSEGRLGVRSGRGFYTYGERDLADYRFEICRRQFRLLEQLGAAPRPDTALHPPGSAATPGPTTPQPDGLPSTGA